MAEGGGGGCSAASRNAGIPPAARGYPAGGAAGSGRSSTGQELHRAGAARIPNKAPQEKV